MITLKQRPFSFSCCLFLLCLFLYYVSGTVFTITVLASAILIGIACLFIKHKTKFILLFIIPPIILSSVISIIHFSINYQNVQSYCNKECDTEFFIIDENYLSDTFSTYTVQFEKINNQKVNFKASLSFGGKLDDPYYSSYSAKVLFTSQSEGQAIYLNNSYSISKGIYINAEIIDEITDNEEKIKPFPSYYFYKINDALAKQFKKYMSGEAGALCDALILGNIDKLSQKSINDFRALGLLHMLAVSGTHFSILIVSLDKLVSKLNINKKKKYIVMILLTFTYAGITGFSPAVKRAAIMLILYYASFLIAKNHDSITALCSSVALICFISPNAILDIGMWLSFFSTYGLLEVAIPIDVKLQEYIEEKNLFISKTFTLLIIPLIYGIVPIIFSLPIMWIAFKEIAIISPISNLVFNPPLLVLMYTCPFILLLFFIPPLAKAIAFVSQLAANFMLYLADIWADHSPVVNINYKFTVFIIGFLIISLLIIALTNTKKKYLYFIPFIVSIILFSVCLGIYNVSNKNIQKMIFSSTYYGDSFLIVSNGRSLLCDASGCAYSNVRYGEYFMTENHIKELDSYIVTDYHARGIDSLVYLADKIKIENLYLPVCSINDDKILEQKFIYFADRYNIKIKTYDPYTPYNNDLIDFYGISVDIKATAKNTANSPNAMCITISNDRKSLSYVSRGFDSTAYGKSVLTNLYNKQNQFIFGKYGKQTEPALLSIKYIDHKRIYFANDDVFEIYEDYISKKSRTSIIKDYYIFKYN
ncbi:MAG: hypothetical protein E7593_05695 [Ruminococcaceae bacterium]|nr:hypothetical protein [Oscillospiraceae bacterium]